MKLPNNIYMRENGKWEDSRSNSCKNPQPLDPHRTIKPREHGATGINCRRALDAEALGASF